MLDHRGVQLAPIRATDLAEVGQFLHEHLNARLTGSEWAAAAVPTWPVRSPNHGFMLRAGDQLVGVQLAFYSERELEGGVVEFCNLGAWCALEEYRSHGVRLLCAALAQRQYTFTDLSPSGGVVPLNSRLGFQSLDTTTALVPHLPLVPTHGARVVSDPDEIEGRLAGHDLRIFRDHRTAAASVHLLLVREDEHCYVVARRDRRKGLPVFASLLHIGNPWLLRRHLRLLGCHLLLHHGVLATLVEVRMLGGTPSASYRLPSSRPKMFRPSPGTRVPAAAIDYLYSELALVAW
jgi:hypothetical protein